MLTVASTSNPLEKKMDGPGWEVLGVIIMEIGLTFVQLLSLMTEESLQLHIVCHLKAKLLLSKFLCVRS